MSRTYSQNAHVSSRRLAVALAMPGLLSLALGCNAAPPDEEEALRIDTSSSPVTLDNGLTTNGLTTNGLTTNGLTTSGLTTSGLSTTDFTNWFNNNSLADMVMRYVVRCAVASGNSVTWTNPVTNVTYTWAGNMGLAPSWAAGNAPSALEQQLVSACLAAHVNKYGVSVVISMLGRDSTGTPTPIGSTELSTWSVREGCFFGNLFVPGGTVYSGSDRTTAANESSDRACALSTLTPGSSAQCTPIVYVGSCATYCSLDSTGTWYESCTYGNTTYRPLTTRIQPSDVYTCGDGVCQVSESCGAGSTPDSCSDCGACP